MQSYAKLSISMLNNFKSINSEADFKIELAKHPRIVAYFSASWCGPCEQFGPVFTAVNKHYPDLQFIKIDIDNIPNIIVEYNINSVPTIVMFYNSKIIQQYKGSMTESELHEFIKDAIN